MPALLHAPTHRYIRTNTVDVLEDDLIMLDILRLVLSPGKKRYEARYAWVLYIPWYYFISNYVSTLIKFSLNVL